MSEHVSQRERLPDRRPSELLDFEHDGIGYTVGLSRYSDGRLAEVFVDGEKVDSATDIAGLRREISSLRGQVVNRTAYEVLLDEDVVREMAWTEPQQLHGD